jgi:hypothetical protein
MFSGFMVDASNIFSFEGLGDTASGMKYSIEWWVFKPKKNGEQVKFYIYNHFVYQNFQPPFCFRHTSINNRSHVSILASVCVLRKRVFMEMTTVYK